MINLRCLTRLIHYSYTLLLSSYIDFSIVDAMKLIMPANAKLMVQELVSLAQASAVWMMEMI